MKDPFVASAKVQRFLERLPRENLYRVRQYPIPKTNRTPWRALEKKTPSVAALFVSGAE